MWSLGCGKEAKDVINVKEMINFMWPMRPKRVACSLKESGRVHSLDLLEAKTLLPLVDQWLVGKVCCEGLFAWWPFALVDLQIRSKCLKRI